MAVVTLALAGLSCGPATPEEHQRLYTMYDIVAAAEAAADAPGAGVLDLGAGYPGGVSAADWVRVTPAGDQLVVQTGFIDSQVAKWVTTDAWRGIEAVWVQPIYRAMRGGKLLDDPAVAEPWVFGVGPKSLFYSPFWEVYGFELPEGVDATSVLDERAVLALADRSGGLRVLDRRITSLVPSRLNPAPELPESQYADMTAAWYGKGGYRYIDFGVGRFTFDIHGVIEEFPMFVFARPDAQGRLVPAGVPQVGGTRPLFSAAPALSNATGGGGGPGNPPTVNLQPNFGGLWRLYLVELPEGSGTGSDGRTVSDARCPNGALTCVTLDSQSAVESLGAAHIHRTEILVSAPLLELGDHGFYQGSSSYAAATP